MKLRNKDHQLLLLLAEKTIKTPCQIWAYGSRVDGSAHETSDLDLVIRTHNLQSLPRDEFSQLKRRLQTQISPLLVQVMDWEDIPQSFKANILANYIVLKEVL